MDITKPPGMSCLRYRDNMPRDSTSCVLNEYGTQYKWDQSTQGHIQQGNIDFRDGDTEKKRTGTKYSGTSHHTTLETSYPEK